MKLYMSELMNANALSKAEPLKAKDLTAAKREASRKQAFQDTVLELGTEVDEEGFLRNVVSCKENGRWEDVDR